MGTDSFSFFCFFFFKQKTAYEMSASLVGSEMCIRDRTTRVDMSRRECFVLTCGAQVGAVFTLYAHP